MKHILKFTHDDMSCRIAMALYRATIEDALTDAIKKLETDEEAANNFGQLISSASQKLPHDDKARNLQKQRTHIEGAPFCYAAEMLKLTLIDIKANYNKVDPQWTDKEDYEDCLRNTTHPMSKEASKLLHEMKTYIIESA
jgi:hypothetical protein